MLAILHNTWTCALGLRSVFFFFNDSLSKPKTRSLDCTVIVIILITYTRPAAAAKPHFLGIFFFFYSTDE